MSKTLIVLMLAVAGPAFAEQSTALTPSRARFGALRPQPDPYKKLFTVQGDPQPARPNASSGKDARLEPRIVCGMTVIPADPKLDPKMAIPLKNDGVDYTMRVVEKSICK